MPARLNSAEAGFEAGLSQLLANREAHAAGVAHRVGVILADVAEQGDSAVLSYTRRFDDPAAESVAGLEVPAQEMARALEALDAETRRALELASRRIADFHRGQRPADRDEIDASGTRLGERWRPLKRAGLYVPGGTAAYPSSLMMNAVPAKVAGVDELVMTVPAPAGGLHPVILAAAHLAGVDRIFRLGGAQAVGALAYGTQTVPAVDKIVGPGNAYVAEAKRQVYGRVGIDLVAGPSEVLICADRTADPEHVAADLLAQAEHDPDAQATLVTDDSGLAEAAERALQTQLQALPRAETAGASWRDYGAVIQVAHLGREAPAIVDAIAPEHLQLAVAEPDRLMAQVRNAGTIFLGSGTPEAMGDYVAGPNHVLPTGRSARFASGLGIDDFLKRTTFTGCSPAALAELGPAAVTLARVEGLEAHALSIERRLPAEDSTGPSA